MSKQTPPTSSTTFRIPEMDCAEELRLIERGLSTDEGVGELRPDFLNRSLQVDFDDRRTSEAEIRQRLVDIGFAPESNQRKEGRGPQQALWSRRTSTISGGILLAVAFAWWLVNPASVAIPAVAVLSTLVSGLPVAAAALRALRLRRIEMNTLMTIAAVGAIAIGEWFEAATAMFLFGVSLWLESYSTSRARRSIESLAALMPTQAHRLVDGEIEDVSADDVRQGERLLVRPGERIPVDGEVARGEVSVNQAPITGESIPVDKSAGDEVYAGSLNGEGSLEIVATRPAQQSTLAHVRRLVSQAQSHRSQTERFVDRFAAWYTPAVVLVAILVTAVPPLAAWLGWYGTGAMTLSTWTSWLHSALVILVIACPCALVISTPVTIVCGLQKAATRGLVIKGGQYLEAAAGVDCIAFDKTGTITTGELKVVDLLPVAGTSREQLLRTVAALEAHSEHPLATAIVEHARSENVSWPAVEQFEVDRGAGVSGVVEGVNSAVGSQRFVESRGVSLGEQLAAWRKQQPAASLIFVSRGETLVGAVAVADQPRTDAREAIERLQSLGVERVLMLTGDSQQIADRVAEQTGVTETHAELLPQDKVELVKRLTDEERRVAMVGDGVNDAPALALADVGIAMGSESSDTALETADVVVMTPRVGRVVELLRLARSTRGILWQNIALSLGIKLIVLALAAMGLATMWMAVAADVGASLMVVANGMRLLR